MVITWKSEARRTPASEIYSTLTTDTIPRRDSLPPRRDTSRVTDTIPRRDSNVISVTDTFSLKFSKDTLDAPIEYEAVDSGVLMVKDKKFILYGNTKTVYKDITLTAPRVDLDQQTNIMRAVNSRDSAGNIIARARFEQGQNKFQSDTIAFNFKTQRGLTRNTYTNQGGEMFVHGDYIKKVDSSTTFAKRLTMTTCDYDDPHFGFVANRGKFINNKLAITGPVHPEFEGVPIPIYLPFGFFPLQQTRHSGIIGPTFGVREQFGIGLEDFGYYQVLNQYIDVTTKGSVYSYGGWMGSVVSSYRKRYHFDGQFGLSINHTKLNFKGDPDFQTSNTFNISWSHRMNPKAKPGTNFSASVNAGSTKYNELLPNNPNRNFQNQLNSSITYSKTWQNKPYSLSLSANHSQNNLTHDINLTFPNAGFTIPTFFPFQQKTRIGATKWYEKLGIGYNGVARNQVVFNDTQKNSLRSLLDTMQWGAQHHLPISFSLPPLGPIIVSPSISYEETWLTHRIHRQWNPTAKKVDTISNAQGLFIDRQMTFAFGLNTTIYGMKTFKPSSKIMGIRHVIRPTLSANYKPNLSKKFYDSVQTDVYGHRDILPQITASRNIFSSYGYGRFGGLSFAVDNNLEMKVKDKKDSTGKGKKVTLIDGFGFSSGYNFLADSLKLLPFNLYFRTTLFGKVSITAQALWNPYQQDTFGRYINKYVWQGDRARLGRLNGGSVSMSTNFQSKPRDPSKAPQQRPTRQVTDPTLMADQERMEDYIRRNPAEFVDFNIPWTLNLSFSLYFDPQYQIATKSYKTTINSNLSFNNSFSLTPKWNFSTNGYYDFNTMKLTMFSMSVSREMHCWQMSVNVTPIGLYRSFNVTLNPKSSILQNLRVNRTRTFSNY